MAIQGLRDTSNFVADQRPKNWREGILLLKPNGSVPLFALTSLMKKRTVDDPEFNWWTKSQQAMRIPLPSNAAALDGTAGSDVVPLTSGGNTTKVGTVLRVEETEELLLVTAVGSDTSITVTRGFAGTTVTLLNTTLTGTNNFLYNIGNAYEEASNAPVAVQFDPAKINNYTQIFRDTLEMSRTAQKTRLRTGDQVKEAKRETLEIHSQGIERAMWFGTKFEGTLNGKPHRVLGGVQSFIDAGNIKDRSAAAVDMVTLEEDFYNIFRFGSNEKMGFCGNRSLLTIQQIIRKNTAYQFVTGEKEFGMNVTRLITPFGEIVLKNHPQFNHAPGGTGLGGGAFYGMESWMFVLDMENLTFVTFEGADTKYEKKLEANDLDGMKSGYMSEVSMEVHHPTTHYLIKGLRAAVADT